jgi:hypothetical protein
MAGSAATLPASASSKNSRDANSAPARGRRNGTGKNRTAWEGVAKFRAAVENCRQFFLGFLKASLDVLVDPIISSSGSATARSGQAVRQLREQRYQKVVEQLRISLLGSLRWRHRGGFPSQVYLHGRDRRWMQRARCGSSVSEVDQGERSRSQRHGDPAPAGGVERVTASGRAEPLFLPAIAAGREPPPAPPASAAVR